ncbi:MAG TPA: serine/threonine-protein kinase [Streptosporangiaceae bacterium]|nr:serine/threonine-protein kinase [Streptosporangiaceae bacterium]
MAELPLVGDEFAGYRLRSVLGRGGMSVVYQAENPRLGSVIALKVLVPELATDDVFRARFLEESRIAASLNHPNVIPIYDTGSSEGLLYIAMRYVSGTDLRQMIKKRGRLIPSTAVFLLGQAARALDAAHRRGLVHRDVKPGNLLIERGGDDSDPDHVYLADFGITKHAMSRSGMTSTGQFLGTVDYVAPEQIQGTSVLGLADQYSLGCVLYECLTGRVPFEKDLDAAIIFAHVTESPTMPTALRSDLPPAVDEVFARVLAKQPGDRYADCREFIEAMRAALGSLAADPRTLGSLDILRTAPTGGIQGSIATEPFRPLELSHEQGTGKAAAEAPAVRAKQGDTVVSHRRQAGEAPPSRTGGLDGRPPPPGRTGPRRRWYARPGWIAALTALVLLAAGAGTWALVSGRSGSHAHGHAASSASAKAKPPSALMSALILANESGGAKGMLPPSTCKQQSATMVTCTAPAASITEVTFRTYPSLTALYDAYTAQVKSLNSGSFNPNFQDCGQEQTYGEVSWNHQFQHPKTYSVAQLSSGKLMDDQAAGRVFCNFTNGQESFVWTQNNGNLLAVVAGSVHEDVWTWWLNIHHNIGFAAAPMNM